jgi:hypothetical protein
MNGLLTLIHKVPRSVKHGIGVVLGTAVFALLIVITVLNLKKEQTAGPCSCLVHNVENGDS